MAGQIEKSLESTRSLKVRGGSAGGSLLKGRSYGGIQKSKFHTVYGNRVRKHDMHDGPTHGGGSTVEGPSKLLVSNLDYGVSEKDIRELFAEFGPLISASVHYDRFGCSMGMADAIFHRRTDAMKALRKYNGVYLDGRPMNILLTTFEMSSKVPIQARLGSKSSRPWTLVDNTRRDRIAGAQQNSAPRTRGDPGLPRTQVDNTRRYDFGGPQRGSAPHKGVAHRLHRAQFGTTQSGDFGGPQRGSAPRTDGDPGLPRTQVDNPRRGDFGGPRRGSAPRQGVGHRLYRAQVGNTQSGDFGGPQRASPPPTRAYSGGHHHAPKTPALTAEELDAELDAYISERTLLVLENEA